MFGKTAMAPAASLPRPCAKPRARRVVVTRAAAAKADPVPPSAFAAALLVQKEEELKHLTSPGRLAPRAAVIAAIRKEIAELRQQLKSAVAAKLPPTLAADLPPPPAPAAPPPAARRQTAAATARTAAYSPPTAAAPPPPAIAAREALLMVERQLSVSSSSSSSSYGAPRGAGRGRSALVAVEQSLAMGFSPSLGANRELAELEAENSLLKGKLEALRERERLLELVKERMGQRKVAEPAVEGDAAAAPAAPATKPRRTRKVATKNVDGEGKKKAAPRKKKAAPKVTPSEDGDASALQAA